MWGRVRELVIYFKFHENRSMGLQAVGGRKSPSPIDKAHGLYNSLYYRTSRDSVHGLFRDVINYCAWLLCAYGLQLRRSPPPFFRPVCDRISRSLQQTKLMLQLHNQREAIVIYKLYCTITW